MSLLLQTRYNFFFLNGKNIKTFLESWNIKKRSMKMMVIHVIKSVVKIDAKRFAMKLKY